MEEYLKRCESTVTTKTWRANMEEEMGMISSKKRKFYSELQNKGYFGGDMEPETENSVSPATSRTAGNSFKHEEYSSGVVKKESPDLENVDLLSEGFEAEISTSINRVFSREATPTSELNYGDSEQVLLRSISTSSKKKSSTPPAISRRKTAENTPSEAELEEFFAAAEKYDQKRFVENPRRPASGSNSTPPFKQGKIRPMIEQESGDDAFNISMVLVGNAATLSPKIEKGSINGSTEKSMAIKIEMNRYNYDIVKDVPLEGKYHWVRLHP